MRRGMISLFRLRLQISVYSSLCLDLCLLSVVFVWSRFCAKVLYQSTGIILGMGSTDERQYYIVTILWYPRKAVKLNHFLSHWKTIEKPLWSPISLLLVKWLWNSLPQSFHLGRTCMTYWETVYLMIFVPSCFLLYRVEFNPLCVIFKYMPMKYMKCTWLCCDCWCSLSSLTHCGLRSMIMCQWVGSPLTHLPLVPHICISELGQNWFRWLLSIGTLGPNSSEILLKIQNFSFTKMHQKISSAKWWPFCPGGDELRVVLLPVHPSPRVMMTYY